MLRPISRRVSSLNPFWGRPLGWALFGFFCLGFATPPAGATALGDAPYVIGANDKIEVFVWKHNDLSMVVDVTADGHVQYPLVGSIPAVGFTPDELAAQIAERLRSYIVEPKVSVIPRNFDRPVVFVVGQVRNPGSHAYRDQARLSDYLAAAGGPTDDAKLSSVTISRQSDGHPVDRNSAE